MTNDNKSSPIKEDIYKTQLTIIQSQRQQIADLGRENTRLKEVERDYNELKQVFGQNGNLTYYQAMYPIQTRKNAEIAAEKQRIDFERQQQWEAEQAAKREAEEKEVIESNPNLIKYFKDEKDKIEQRKTKILDLATRFYEMTEDEIKQYIDYPHKPKNSAVMDLINEFEDEKGYLRYQCNYCEEEADSLREFERHCYDEGQDHRDVNLRRIQDRAIEASGKVSAELQKNINDAIISKKNTEHRKRLEEQKAQQDKAAKNLPFVS